MGDHQNKSADEILQSILRWNAAAFLRLHEYLKTDTSALQYRSILMELCRTGLEQNLALQKSLKSVILVPVEDINEQAAKRITTNNKIAADLQKDLDELNKIYNIKDDRENG